MMTTLQTCHPCVYEKITSGAFAGRNATHALFAIVMDHAHEQENASSRVTLVPLDELKTLLPYNAG